MLAFASVGAVVAGLFSQAAPPWASQMRSHVQRSTRGFSGALGLCVVDVARGETFGYRDEAPMYLASGVKIAFMIAVFRAIERGELELDTELTYRADDIRDGAPRINRRKVGERLRVEQLLEWMMRYSDNAASDLLVDRVGLDAVSEGLLEEGILGFTPLTRLIDVRRGIYRALDVRADDLSPIEIRQIRWTSIWKPQVRKLERLLGRPSGTFSKGALLKAYERFYATGVNRAPMRAVARVFEKMLAGKLVSPEASRSMLELMSGARTSRNRLLGRLPRRTLVAHKTGSQYLHFCDLGIVFLPMKSKPKPSEVPKPKARSEAEPLIITMCTERAALIQAERLMAGVARRAYDLALEVRNP